MGGRESFSQQDKFFLFGEDDATFRNFFFINTVQSIKSLLPAIENKIKIFKNR